MLRGASKDTLMEIERNLQDAMHVTRNVALEPRLVPGGGAVEMALSKVVIRSHLNCHFRFLPSFSQLALR